MIRVPFSKYTGCGNDFILIDNRQGSLRNLRAKDIARLCHRNFGIGADGLILLENGFRMRIFNSDGSEAEMCGNGVRCLMKFIKDLGYPEKKAAIQTLAGTVHVSLLGDLVAVSMPNPDKIMQHLVEIDNQPLHISHLDTGVPHAVIFVEDLPSARWMELAPKIRFHPAFAPKGTNVNFAQVREQHIILRTYERGVEKETEACGTGATATAVAAAHLYNLASPIKILPKSLIPIEISFTKIGRNTFKDLVMAGPAEKIFHGEFILD